MTMHKEDKAIAIWAIAILIVGSMLDYLIKG